jgi:hypothetical protein
MPLADSPRISQVHELELTHTQQCADRYVRVPVDVPPGLDSLEVQLEVMSDGARIDLGCEGPRGWRGWSGGAHRHFTIGTADASPGYLPGPLEAGRWSVVLGIHALEEGPAPVRVSVQGPATNPPEHGPMPVPAVRTVRGSERDLPAPPGMRWYTGDSHSHSLHSDGGLSLDELADEGVLSGLDFLCVTDHNTTSHHRLLTEVAERHDITLIPGQEVTTHRGHANAFGDIGFVDFRGPAQQWADEVLARGGFLSINHPMSGDCSWLEEVPDGVAGVEILHSDLYREPISTVPFGWLNLLLTKREQQGLPRPSLLAGGDFHRRGDGLRPGTPTLWVCAEENTSEAILAGMRAGRTTLTASVIGGGHASVPAGTSGGDEHVLRPDLLGAPIAVRADDDHLRVFAADGLMLVGRSGERVLVEGTDATVSAPIDQGPWRIEDEWRRTVAVGW